MITKFDEYKNRMCWVVNIEQPYFDIICWKLGVPENRFNFINNKDILSQNKVRNTICIEYLPEISAPWQWDRNLNNAQEITNIKYMGYLSKEDLSEEDIMDWKIYQNSKKYNL